VYVYVRVCVCVQLFDYIGARAAGLNHQPPVDSVYRVSDVSITATAAVSVFDQKRKLNVIYLPVK